MAIQFWEFPVQWAGPFTVVESLQTEIISSESGKEQRRALRFRPRRQFSFGFACFPDMVDSFQVFMATAQRNEVVVPEVTRSQKTTTALQIGLGQVTVDEVAEWMSVAGYVAMVYRRRVEVFQITAIVGSVLTFDGVADSGDWPAGTRIVPAWKGLLTESLSFDLVTSEVMTGGIDFSVLPGEELSAMPEASFEDFAIGREIFNFPINWGESPSLGFVQTRSTVDYGTGVVSTYTPVAYSNRVYSIDLWAPRKEVAKAVSDFFYRMQGRRGEFLLSPPTRATLKLAQPYAPDALSALVAGTAARLAFQSDETYRVMRFEVPGGYPHYRRVLTAVNEGGNTRLTFDLGIPELISVIDGRIAWAVLTRFETDELTVDWLTTETAACRVTLRSLGYEDSELVSEFDEGTQWLIDYYGSRFVIEVIFGSVDRVLNVIEPRFALVVDAATQYLIDTFNRDPANRWLLDGTLRVLNVIEPQFAEI